MTRPLLAALLLCLCSCDGKGSDTGSEGDADIDTDADTDPNACCTHSGLRNVGGTWDWAWTSDHREATGVSGEWTSSLERDGDSLYMSQEGEQYDSWTGTETVWTALFEYRCDVKGAWIVHAETEYTYESATVDGDGWSDTVYDEPALVMPRWLGMGTDWTQEAGGTITSEAAIVEFLYVTDYDVVSQASTDVPAGEFETWVVEWTTSDEVGSLRVAPGVGPVWTGETELRDWSHD